MAFNMTRRKFLQTASLAAASVPLSKVTARANPPFTPVPLKPSGSFKNTKTVSGGVCEMCFWRCQAVGKVRDGRLVKLEGNPKSIDNGTALCARGNSGVQLLYDPDRLKYPLKNVGKRGDPKWKKISWQEALDECAQKFKGVKEKYGAKGISLYPHGSSAVYATNFFEHVIGTENVSEASFFQCRGMRDVAYLETFGMPPGENVDMANAKAMLFIGCHLGENVHLSHLKKYLKGLENGAELIVVDPRFSASAAKANNWVKIKPGTDTAFLVAIMNYLVENGKYDKDFIADYSWDFDKFKEGISHASLKWAADICDIPASQIKEVAETLAAKAPNVSIHPGRHVSWYGNDFQRERALACLTALLGAVGVEGGWVPPKGPSGLGSVSWPEVAHHDKETDMYELTDKYHFHPPGVTPELLRNAAISGEPYPVKATIIWGQNIFKTLPDQEATIKALKAMDFVMCVDVMPTDITAYADILLPEASYLERYDYIKTGTQWDFSDKHQQFIAPRMPLVDPLFERKDPVWITNELAKKMGYEDQIPVSNQKEKLEKELAPVNLSVAKIKKENGIHIQPGENPYQVPEGFELSLYSGSLEEKGYPAVPTYTEVEEPPKGYARLLYGRSPVHTFNRSLNNVWLHHEMPENPLWLNDETARKLGIEDGDHVALVNSEGVESNNTTPVKVTPGIRKDSVYLAHGYGTVSPKMTVTVGKGIDDQRLITKPGVDPETGCYGMRTSFVKLVKSGKVLDIPA